MGTTRGVKSEPLIRKSSTGPGGKAGVSSERADFARTLCFHGLFPWSPTRGCAVIIVSSTPISFLRSPALRKVAPVNAQHRRLSRRTFCAASAGLATFGFNRLATAADTDTSKVITLLAKFKINTDKEAEAIATLKELCAAVEKNEPGVLIYLCHRAAKKPDELVFFEVYKDEAAYKAHGKTPHFAKLRNGLGTLFRLPLEVARLDRIAGFAR